MSRSRLAAGLALVAVVALAGPPAAGAHALPSASDATAGEAPAVEVVAVYPNPATDEDRGEFLLLSVERPTNLSSWTVDDGEETASLRGRVEGRVAVTAHPERVRALAANGTIRVDRVLGVDALPALSNGGERIRLRRDGETVASVAYADAPERSLYREGTWRHLDATNRPVARVGARPVRAFVLPDGSDVPADLLAEADRRVLLAGYTFESERAARAVERAAARGVEVRVLVDADPVGGVSRRQVRLLDRLAGTGGVEVWAYGTATAPYAYHHAKYAVVDDRALVTTENWEPGGLGGASNRGWGAVVSGPEVAAELVAVFEADASRPAAVPWTEYRDRVDPVYVAPDDGSYPERIAPARLHATSVRVLTAPDNAQSALVDLLDGAERSLRVEQVSMEHGPLLSAVVDAARRGVRVRVLLSGADGVWRENRRLAEALNARADREGWDLRVRVADPDDRFGAIHTKGAVVDGEHVVVGSLNWNDHSPERNREVVLVLTGEAVADYYGRAFAADYGDGGGGRTWLWLAALAAAVLAGVVGYRRIAWRPR